MSISPPPPTAAVEVCGNCGTDDRWILHYVRHQGGDKTLCTSCVLKLHPPAFCPLCFSLHDANSLHPLPSVTSLSGAGKTFTCFKCLSHSHCTCVPPNAPKSPYLCPPCSNPNFKFFDIRESQALDKRTSTVFLSAAKIAGITMSKAVALARADVDRKVKESALARKRATEAIDHYLAVNVRVGGPVKVEKNGGGR